MSEETPEDWRRGAIIIPIHEKEDRQECNNSRGISLLSTPAKYFIWIILNRITEKVDEALRETQSGLRRGRRCSDLIQQLNRIKFEYNMKWLLYSGITQYRGQGHERS